MQTIKMSSRGIFFLFLLIAVSCERLVDFPVDHDGRIYVDAVLGGGSGRVNVMVSQPIGGSEDAVAEDVAVCITADGEPVKLVRDTDYKADIEGVVSYLTDASFVPGQKLVLEASADGLPAVKAVTSVPADLPVVSVVHDYVENYKDGDSGQHMSNLRSVSRFTIELDEQVKEDSFFGIQVLRYKTHEFEGEVPDYVIDDYEDGEIGYDDIYVNTVMPEGGALSSVRTDMTVVFDGGEMLVSPATPHDGKSVLSVDVEQRERYRIAGHGDGFNWIYCIYECYRYKIRVFRLSPEMYHCLRAEFIADESDAPIHLGFTPVTYTYTNVEGGLGMFGAVASYETEWI